MTEVASASMLCENSGTIPVSCVPYRGARGFTTLIVERRGGQIVLDAQVTNGCVISSNHTTPDTTPCSPSTPETYPQVLIFNAGEHRSPCNCG